MAFLRSPLPPLPSPLPHNLTASPHTPTHLTYTNFQTWRTLPFVEGQVHRTGFHMNALRTEPQTFLAWSVAHSDVFQLTNDKYLVKVLQSTYEVVV